MSNPDSFIVGQFKLHDFAISTIGDTSISPNRTIHIQDQVTSFNISESIYKGFVSGSFRLLDTNNLVQNFPINGEEKLTIVYEDWFGVKREDEFFIYSVVHDEILFKKSDVIQSYTIHFCSIGRFLASTQLVRKGFNTAAFDAAIQLFDTYFTQLDKISTKPKKLLVEDSSGVQRLVIPSYNPIDAMHFLARNAYKEEGSSTFRFCETRKNFWFASVEHMIEVAEKSTEDEKNKSSFFVSSKPENSLEEEKLKMFQIQGIKYLTRVNTIAEMDNGNYKRRIIELDVLNKEVTAKSVSLIDDGIQYFTDSANSKQTPNHSKSFVDNVLAEPYDVFIIKDWSQSASDLRPDPNNRSLVGIKNMQLLNEKTNDIELLVYGRNNLFAGFMVDVELPMFQSRGGGQQPEIDKERSGKYFITSINNEFIGSTYYQTLTLTRFGKNTPDTNTIFEKIPRITPDEKIKEEPYYGAGSPRQSTPNANTADVSTSNILVDTPTGKVTVPAAWQYNRNSQ